ncbi:MAG: DUF2726 domain-containing protein [Solirubrobacterales bacterium]
MQGMVPVIGLLIALGVLVFVIKMLFHGLPGGRAASPYRREPALFTAAERSFLGVLEQAVQGQSRVFGKVRLADIINVKSGLNQSERQRALNRLLQKHVDFVLCDPKELSLQMVIELDDSSHETTPRQARDAFLDEALAAADVRILHVPAKRTYSVQDIRDAILSRLPDLGASGSAQG